MGFYHIENNLYLGSRQLNGEHLCILGNYCRLEIHRISGNQSILHNDSVEEARSLQSEDISKSSAEISPRILTLEE